MKFFTTTLFALPLLGAVLGSPVPVKDEKRLLGLDLGLGGVSDTLDLQGLLDGLTKDLVSFILHFNACAAADDSSNLQSMHFSLTLVSTTWPLSRGSSTLSRVSWTVLTRSSRTLTLVMFPAHLTRCRSYCRLPASVILADLIQVHAS